MRKAGAGRGAGACGAEVDLTGSFTALLSQPPVHVLHVFSYSTASEHAMTNLTIAIDEAIVRQARVRAIQEGTSVSAKVREFLAGYALGEQAQQSAAQAFIDAARISQANASGTRWSREDAHQRPYPGSA
jgi:plasmid stability protein